MNSSLIRAMYSETHTKASEHMSQKELGTAAAEDFCVDFVAMAGNEADFLGLPRASFPRALTARIRENRKNLSSKALQDVTAVERVEPGPNAAAGYT